MTNLSTAPAPTTPADVQVVTNYVDGSWRESGS